MTSEKDARPSYLLETTQTNALHLRNKNTDEGYEEEKKDVGHHQESGFVENYDTSMVSSPGGPLNPQAVYIEQTRMHTDTNEDTSMAEEDLGLDEEY